MRLIDCDNGRANERTARERGLEWKGRGAGGNREPWRTVNGCLRRSYDGLARRPRGNERMPHQECGISCYRWRMRQRAGRVGEPQRSAFGDTGMIAMRPVCCGVRSKVPVDEGTAVRRPERTAMHVLWRQYRGGQEADQGDQHGRSVDGCPH
jgi:hypothetical protein